MFMNGLLSIILAGAAWFHPVPQDPGHQIPDLPSTPTIPSFPNLAEAAKELIALKLKLQDYRQAVRRGELSSAVVQALEAQIQQLESRILQQERSRTAQPTRSSRSTVVIQDGPIKRTVPKWTIRLSKDEEYSADANRVKEKILEKACVEVANWIRERYPLSRYQPTPEYLRQENIIKNGPQVEEHPSLLTEYGGKIYTASMDVELMPEVQRELLAHGQASQNDALNWLTFDRGWRLTCILLVALSGLVIMLGYFFVDERTQGYFSKPLLAGAIGGFIAVSLLVARSLI